MFRPKKPTPYRIPPEEIQTNHIGFEHLTEGGSVQKTAGKCASRANRIGAGMEPIATTSEITPNLQKLQEGLARLQPRAMAGGGTKKGRKKPKLIAL